MTFRPFYLFYLLAILLLVFGFLARDVEIIAASWHTTIYKGMWSFFIPAATGALLTGLIYHYWLISGRPVRNNTVILHFVLVCPGLFFSVSIYRLSAVLFSSGAPDTLAIGVDSSFLFILLGPALLIVSLVVFLIGLVKAWRA